MIFVQFLFFTILLASCGTQSEKWQGNKLDVPEQKILDIPFVAQSDYHCGPAVLSMVSASLGKETSVGEISKMLYTPDSKGTFQNDLVGATRRLGLIALPINNLPQIFREINDGHPVIIFQNLGLTWIPRWHYALVVGYDLLNQELILHSGAYKNYRFKISVFEKTWSRVENWGLVVVAPGTIPHFASELEIVKAVARIEAAHFLEEAKISYEKILEKWPTSLGAMLGLGNIYYQKNQFKESYQHLKKATILYPEVSGVWHNYALVLQALNKREDAELALKKEAEILATKNLH